MNRLTILVSALFFVTVSCKKEVNNKPDETPPRSTISVLPKDVTTKSIDLIFPANTAVDAASCSIYSQSFISYSEKDGSYTIAYEKGFPNIAWVLDKNKNVILAGFITDSTKTISVGSTAEVLLYFGLGTTFQPDEVIQKYIKGANSVPGMAEWKAQLENIFLSDPQMLNKHLFAGALKQMVVSVLDVGTTTERKAADITVDANDIRSGLQIAEAGLSSYTITNTSRRRGYAYLYKMNYTDKDGKLHTVNSEVSGGISSLSETKISPTTAIRDYKGVLQDWIAGNGEKFASTVSSPIEVPLEDNESVANFKVRVIGPGMPVNKSMTSYERERWWNITLQTALFDFLLPAVLDVIGHKEFLNSIHAPGNKMEGLENMVKKTGDIIGAIPTLSDALEAGDYSTLIPDVFYTIVNGKLSSLTDDFIKSIYFAMGNYMMKAGSNYYTDPSAFDDRVENLVKVLEILDIGMKAIDYGRIARAIVKSKTLEEWDLKAREVQINLDPPSFETGEGKSKVLTAYIKTSLGTDPPVIEYEWETSGKYGYLTDERGHQGKAFSSSLNKVTYNVSAKDFSSGIFRDTINVAVYVKKGANRIKVGTSMSVAIINNDVFSVSWKGNVNIVPKKDINGKDVYDASNPYFSAEFKERKDAKYYNIRIIRKDGVKTTGTRYNADAFPIKGGMVQYKMAIGRSFHYFDLTESQAAEERTRQEQMLNDYVGSGIEVTVIY